MNPITKAFLALEMTSRLDVAALCVQVGWTSRLFTPVANHLLFESQQLAPTWTRRALA